MSCANRVVQAAADAFLKRFWNFHDSVIRGVELGFPSSGAYSGNVSVLTRDADDASAWVVCTLVVTGLREFRLLERHNMTYRVTSDGIKLGWFEGKVYVNLDPSPNEISTLDEYRESNFYLAGSNLNYTIAPAPSD